MNIRICTTLPYFLPTGPQVDEYLFIYLFFNCIVLNEKFQIKLVSIKLWFNLSIYNSSASLIVNIKFWFYQHLSRNQIERCSRFAAARINECSTCRGMYAQQYSIVVIASVRNYTFKSWILYRLEAFPYSRQMLTGKNSLCQLLCISKLFRV